MDYIDPDGAFVVFRVNLDMSEDMEPGWYWMTYGDEEAQPVGPFPTKQDAIHNAEGVD